MPVADSERTLEPEPERGLLLAVLAQGADDEDELAELRELARAAGVAPVAHVVQHRARSDPRTYVGKGKLDELKDAYASSRAEVLLVDEELKPTQQRALEDALSARVVDRTQLILDIFAQHAVSAEGKLQVELAQLEYNLPRMRGMWKHLERLAGGGGTAQVGGGVGTRGPGESQLETDRRLANRRITLLRRRLREVGAHRATRRKARQPLRDADGRARGLHERREVDVAQRADGRRGLRREPPLRDARPDDARRSTTWASATSSPTRSGSSGACRHSSSRGSPRRSRRRSSPTSSSTSWTRRCPRTCSASRCGRSRASSPRSAPPTSPSRSS